MDVKQRALEKHAQWGGKIEVISRAQIESKEDLSLAYTPGVAQPCLEIEKNPDLSYTYTRRANMVAVITDGSAVLGLGNIGALAGMPVMEGKCVLFKEFGGVDAFPICVSTQDTQQIIDTVKAIAGSFGGINLEDISAPRCFEIERRLKKELDIPVFHDDQHGTAVVTLAGLINAMKLIGKKLEDVKVVIQGTGAAGAAIAKLLLAQKVKEIIMCDRKGILYQGRENMDESKKELARLTNQNNVKGGIGEALENADVMIGVSGPNTVSEEMIGKMNKDAVVFAMSNPVPEIMPDAALRAGARIVGTGRSDFANQINNVLAFPGIFKGALSVRASDITDAMLLAAAKAIAAMVEDDKLSETYIIPDALNKNVAQNVADAVATQAIKDGVNRI